MKVKLISFTRPSPELQEMGIESAEELVAYCARISNPDNQLDTETAAYLVGYLINHKHWSPLEMVNICMEIITTRDIARQILRHRSFSFQEFSQRYADPLSKFGFTLREARMQNLGNRQSSLPSEDQDLNDWWLEEQRKLSANTRVLYNTVIRLGIAKEVARCILPEGLTPTRLYMNGSLRSWIHYIDARLGEGTQKEHSDIAKECAKVIAQIFPMYRRYITPEHVPSSPEQSSGVINQR